MQTTGKPELGLITQARKIADACGRPLAHTYPGQASPSAWRWSHPDGREWVEPGDCSQEPPEHPALTWALRWDAVDRSVAG